MENAGRDPVKQAKIEATLKGIRSKAYADKESRILSGIYRKDRATRNRNRANLEKTRARLTKKIERGSSKQIKGDEAKIEKIDTLLPIIDDETNVENDGHENDSAPKGSPAAQQEIHDARDDANDTGNGSARKESPVAQEKKKDCEDLFDPCTKEPIASLEALEKRIRDIKKQRDIVPVGLYGLTNDTSNYDFLTNVFIDPKVSLDDMVSFRLSAGGQVGSDIYEVLSRLFVFFGGIENVNPRQGGNYKFMKKIEGDAPEIYDDSVDALKKMKCKATRAMGISDITLTNVRNDKKVIKPDDPYCEVDCDTKEGDNIKTYLISVKWYKDEKNAEHYDLEKLFTAAQKITSAEQKPLDIIVFLRSKVDFEIAHNRSYRQYTRDIAKTFFGWNEDVKPFLEEKRRSIFELANRSGKSPLEALGLQYFKPNAKPILSLQLHQDIIVKGICDSLETVHDNLYLIGVLPRGGKTFIAGGIIREYLRRTKIKNLNTFWLTAAPNETMTQVKDELLNRFQDFSEFEFIEVKSVSDIKKTKPHSVFFCSSQLLIASQKRRAKKRDFLKDLLSGKDRLGLLFFDEAHKTGTGDNTKDNIESIIQIYNNLKLPFIFLTATYYNILFDYQIQKANTFIWDYTDVLATRSLATETEQASAISNLQERFGKDLVDSVIESRIANNETLETMAKAYIGFPDLYFISADFQEDILQRFTDQDKYRPDSGFSLSSIFAIKQGLTIADVKTAENKVRKDAYKIFDNLTNPKNIISLITPKEVFDNPDVLAAGGGEPLVKEGGSIIEPSLLGRINKMSSDAKSRFRLDEQPTLLMFMPTGGVGTNIFYLLCAWASLLMTHKWWRENYEIACIVSEENVGTAVGDLVHMELQASEGIHIINKNPKASILRLERKLHCEKSKGLLVLAGEKLSMGISLPCTDIVFLFNEKKSPDDIIQKMYRALTPSPGKKSAFIVDLNPVRTLAALYGYTRASHESSNTASQILDIIYDTYSWDSDIFEYGLKKGSEAGPLSFQDKLRQLFEMAENDTDYRINEDIGGLEKKLGDNIKRGIDSEFVGKIAGQFSSKRLEASLARIGFKEASKIALEKGMLIIRVPKGPDDSEAAPVPGEDTEIVIQNFIETVAAFVKYLAITSHATTLEGALEEYEKNTYNQGESSLRRNVLHLVHSRTEIKGIDEELLSKLLITAVKDFAFTSSNQVFRQMKGDIDEKSLRKDKILAIINRRLTPRQKQKKEAGEVFTPIALIEKIIAHLPKSVWKNPDLKWIDPANGIGNFPVVIFYKLDEGLKEWEPNEKKRRKHIIENMLYMIELQSNNNRVARRIFESLCEGCKPNILTANTVELTPEKLKAKGFPEKYDIVMGNPPFQKGAYRSFYLKFINFAYDYIKENGYLVYVIPNKILIPNDVNKAIKKFNPLFIYHTLNREYFPSISTTICGVVAKKEPLKKETKVFFSNGEKIINLDTPTPTQNDDIHLKEVSDKIFFGTDRKYLDALKLKPETKHIYLHSIWTRYSPDKPSGGTHVFDIIDPPSVRAEGKYIEIPSGMDKSLFTWYLSRSEAMRFITMIYAGAMNVPAFIWDIIPSIPLKSETDSEVYKLLGLNDSDIQIIKKSLSNNIQGEIDEEPAEGGGRQRSFTRKVRRT